jgi:stage II sporulation protein R
MMRVFGNSIRVSYGVKIVVTVILTISIVATFLLSSYSEEVNKGLADNLVRLHVIANSNSPEDQALKLDVRDKILEYMKIQLKDSKNVGQSYQIIRTKLKSIEDLVNAEIKRQGKDFPAKVNLGSYPFPTKSYGDITLPAGNYQALRVVIGNGTGKNWWCVIFPPLCFVDVTHGSFPDSAKEELKTALTAEEYDIVANADSEDDIPVKIKFKIVEFFQDSKIKFAGLMSKLFNTK